MANRFGALDVEDLDEYLNVAAVDVFIPNKRLAKGHRIDFYELECQYDLLLLENLHRQQNTLKKTRGSYKAGTCDLMLVSVFSNLASNLIRRAEDKVISLDQNRYAKPLSQESLSLKIIYADSFSKGEDLKARLASNERLRIKLFDAFVTFQQLGL